MKSSARDADDDGDGYGLLDPAVDVPTQRDLRLFQRTSTSFDRGCLKWISSKRVHIKDDTNELLMECIAVAREFR